MQTITKLTQYMNANRRVLLVSPPALSKSSLIELAAAALGRKLVITAAGIKERVDFSGAIVPDFSAGYAKELLLETIYNLVNTKEPTIWFLDDLGNAPIDVQAGIKANITKGGAVTKNPNVLVWAATNRPGDKTGVFGLHESLRSEFHMAFAMPTPDFEARVDGATPLCPWTDEDGGSGLLEQWNRWAMDYGAPAEIIAWHRSTGGSRLYQWRPHADPGVRMADFRTWHSAIDLWNANIRDLDSLSAAIGRPGATEYLAFSQLTDKVPTPDEVRKNPEKAPVPKDRGALYLVATMLASAATEKDGNPFTKYLRRLPRVYGALLGRDLYRKLDTALSSQKEWCSFFVENQQLFLGGE